MLKIEQDWLIELKFNVPVDTNYVISETLFLANLLASNEKIDQEHYAMYNKARI